MLSITNNLYARELIPTYSREEILYSHGQNDSDKARMLVKVIDLQLESSLNPNQYLADICHVLINQRQRVADIANDMLQQLGIIHYHYYTHSVL